MRKGIKKFLNISKKLGIAKFCYPFPFIRKKIILFCLICLLMSLSCRCPYGFKVNSLPGHLKTVAIPTFENQTFQYGIEEDFTQILVEEVENDNSLKVQNDLDEVDSVLEGEILSYSKEKASYNESGVVTGYKVTIAVKWEFRDKVKNRVYAGGNRMSNWETYLVPEGDTEELELEAREKAMEKLAEDIIAKIVQNW